MKKFLVASVLFIAACIGANAQQAAKSFYDFKMKTLEGETFDFNQLKGKKVLVVNLAQKCGTASQYDDLEKLYEKYKSQGFVILGFPSSDFLNQAPGSNEELKTTCKKNFGFTFPVFEKLHVKKGPEQDPLYAWLTKKELNGVANDKVSWNTYKFMIDENGHLMGSVGSFKSPDNKKILNWLDHKS